MTLDKKTFTTEEFPKALCGADFMGFQREIGYSNSEMSVLFGLNKITMVTIINSANKVVEDATICLLYRMYKDNPSLLYRPVVSIEKFYDTLREEMALEDIRPPTKTDFSLVFGSSQTSYVRWFKKSRGGEHINAPRPSVELLLSLSMKVCDNNVRKTYAFINGLVEMESACRGFNPLDERNWSFDDELRAAVRRKGVYKKKDTSLSTSTPRFAKKG